MKHPSYSILILALLCSTARGARSASPPPLKKIRTIPLPGVEGRFDHFAIDAAGKRLFVSALGNNTLEVLDLQTGKHLGSVPGLHKPQGIAFVPEANRFFVGCGQSGTCECFDGRTLARISSAPGMDNADNVRCDPEAGVIYVGYGTGALGILDAKTGTQVGTIPLKAHPESFQLERSGNRLFVNVPGAGSIVVIDRKRRQVIGAWPVEGASANFPMALDEPEHRLIVGCRGPARALVFDTDTGKQVCATEIAADTDDLYYDAARKRVYVSCGDGYLTVLQERDPDHFEPLARILTPPGARTCGFSPELNRLYLAVPHREAQAAAIYVYDVAPR